MAGGRGALWVPVAFAVLLILYPVLGGGTEYWIRQIALIAVFALVVSGFNLSFGYAGELQFGQLFMLALGADLAAALSTRLTFEIIPLMLIGGAAAVVVGLLLVIPALRVGGWALAIASFYIVVALPSIVRLLEEFTGGGDGIALPIPTLFGNQLDDTGVYYVTMALLVVWFIVYRNLVRSRYGVIFRTLKQSPVLASSLGYSPRRLKVMAYAYGAFPAGAAGVLYAFLSQYIVPEMFTLHAMIGIIAAAVFGGVYSVYGAFFGAALLQLGPLSSASFQTYASVAFGVFLIVAGIAFRRGIAGIGTSIMDRVAVRVSGGRPDVSRSIATAPLRGTEDSGRATHESSSTPAVDEHRRNGHPLEVRGVSKAFAGVQALQDVAISAPPGEVTALIGSNGSGKTTLLNVICGYVDNDAGEVLYGGANLAGLAPHEVARHGVGRTFQTPNLPSSMTVLDAVAAGRFRGDHIGVWTSVLRLPRQRRAQRADRKAALAALDLVGLRHLAEDDAASQPLGTRRLIEVARMLCGDSGLLLLDEPASGLSESEVRTLGDVITAAARNGATVVLIEHNFEFVTSISDTAFVLHLGELVATGEAATIGDDPAVVESYLGRPRDGATSSDLDGDEPPVMVPAEDGGER